MIIIGSYHKTGSLLFSNIWKSYFDQKTRNYIDNKHFDRVTNDMIKKIQMCCFN